MTEWSSTLFLFRVPHPLPAYLRRKSSVYPYRVSVFCGIVGGKQTGKHSLLKAVEKMCVTSMIEVNGVIVAQWNGNDSIAQFFAPYADAFECDGDTVALPITQSMIDDMVSEVEDFLAGIADESARENLSGDAYLTGTLRYVEHA